MFRQFVRRSILIVASVFASLHSVAAFAEALVTGERNAVRIEARDAPVENVMAALGARFGLQYRSAIALDRRITGTYEGPLERVVSRLLEGNDFVIKTTADGLEATVYAGKLGEAQGGRSVRATPYVPPPSPARTRRNARQSWQAD
jgi:hypothetical protein